MIGTFSRTYSGSGGAFSLAFFDALVYDQQTVGGALRSAKNFMLAFARLKERRLGTEAKLGGANVRAAWAFTLWGDPTVQLPRPVRPAEALPAVKHVVKGNTIVVTLPDAESDPIYAIDPDQATASGATASLVPPSRHRFWVRCHTSFLKDLPPWPKEPLSRLLKPPLTL